MKILGIVQKLVWGPWLLVLFLTVGGLCMIRLRGFPILHIRIWLGKTVGSGEKGQLLTTCMALAATVGTGNITGVAAALAIGGPGAVFWMWAAAFLGMALAYGEVYLGILYRRERREKWEETAEKPVSEYWTGPYVYLEEGLGSRFAGNGYALFCVMSSLGMGCMVQAGALADSLYYAGKLSHLGTGIVLTAVTAAVLFGGAGRIGRIASVLVPVSAGLYLLAGGIAVFSFYDRIPDVLVGIVSGAFGKSGGSGAAGFCLLPSGVSGGIAGYGMAAAMRSGVSRGVFSNEAGLGSLAILHGISGEEKKITVIDKKKEDRGKKTDEERKKSIKAGYQGMWAVFEVFFDTIIGCSLTAFLLLCVFPSNLTGTVRSLGESGAVSAALAVRFGTAGGMVMAACMVLFAFATMIAWFYIGEQALGWLLRDVPEKWTVWIRIFYHGLYLTSAFLGCISRMEAVWALSDIFNGLMAVPNLTALVLLVRQIKRPEM